MNRIIHWQRQWWHLIPLLCTVLFLSACQPIIEPTTLEITSIAFVRNNVLYVQPGEQAYREVAVEDCHRHRCRILFPKWSPDGTRLLYYYETLDESRIVQIRVATLGGDTQTVTEIAASTRPADWSPDGTQVLYLHDTPRFKVSPHMGEVRVLEVWTSDIDIQGHVQNPQLQGEIGFGDGCGGGGRSNSAEVYEVEGGFAYGYLAGIVEWTADNIVLFSNNCGSRGIGRFDLSSGQELIPYAEPLSSLTLDSSGKRWAAIDSQNRIVVGTPNMLTYRVLHHLQYDETATLELVYFGSFSGRLYYSTLKRVGEFVDLADTMNQLEEEIFASPYFDFTQPALYTIDPTLNASTLLWQGDGYAYTRFAEAPDGSLFFARVESNERLFNALMRNTVTAEAIDTLLPTVDVFYFAANRSMPVRWLTNAQQVTLATTRQVTLQINK